VTTLARHHVAHDCQQNEQYQQGHDHLGVDEVDDGDNDAAQSQDDQHTKGNQGTLPRAETEPERLAPIALSLRRSIAIVAGVTHLGSPWVEG
jgi:hypothetical protein